MAKKSILLKPTETKSFDFGQTSHRLNKRRLDLDTASRCTPLCMANNDIGDPRRQRVVGF